jgi:hypothetical protein
MNTMTTYKISDHPNKAAVIEKHRDINVESIDWWDSTYEAWIAELEALGYSEPDIQFSGFWSQGDGASFTCDQVPLPHTDPDVMAAWNQLVGAAALLGEDISEEASDLACGKVYRINHRYSHERTVTVDWEWNDPPFYNGEPPEGLEPFAHALTAAVTDYFEHLEDRVEALCSAIYKDLRAEYEYLTSDEGVEEALEANDYEIDEDGNLV